MVRILKYILAFFRLVRISNLLIMAATLYFLRWFVLKPVLAGHNLEPQMSEWLFFLLTVATLCIAGAGYVINDYFDRKADLINRPERVILGRVLSRRSGMFWHSVLTTAGILIGGYVSYKMGNIKLSLIFFVISGMLWFYSTTYKKQVLLGNVVVAFLVACIPLLVLVYEFPIIRNHNYSTLIKLYAGEIKYLIVWIAGYSVFAFFLTLIREIVKDLEDYEGDFAFGRQTIPIAWGPVTAKILIQVFSLFCVVLLLLIIYKLKWSLISVLYCSVLLVVPLIVQMYIVYSSNNKKSYTLASGLLKAIMLSGLIYMIIAANWVL
jgi:4-hydroxybenzoate polyprenyltransferase